MNDLREQARHHWQGILSNLGISGSLKNKHQPCPCCGGKDRFRFATNAAQATASNSS